MKIVATYVSASSQGQRTHSARTNVFTSHNVMLSQVSSIGFFIFLVYIFLFNLPSFLPPFLLLPALCHWISFLVPNIWSAWPCLKILWQVVSRQLMWLGEGTLLLVNEGLQVHLSSGQGQGGRGRFGPEEEGEQH